MSKAKLGQFYTTNYTYILEGFSIPPEIHTIIEPFAGKGDLLKFITNKDDYKIECYDIDPKADYIIKKDTIKYPPNYSDKFVLTNPPYLARNKSSDKDLFDKYDSNDLYKCFIEELIKNPPLGGIIIIPLNFWSSIRASDIKLRKNFLNTFSVSRINIFEEQVFSDTSYTVCSLQFKLKEQTESSIYFKFFPSGKEFLMSIDERTNYTFGGEIYCLPQNPNITVDRLTKKNSHKIKYITNILVKCIDDNSQNMLGLSITTPENRYIDNTKNLSSRSYATLVITPALSDKDQIKLVDTFNKFMKEKRDQYNSLFLTNFRESKDIARKRISFNLVYEIVNYLISCSYLHI